MGLRKYGTICAVRMICNDSRSRSGQSIEIPPDSVYMNRSSIAGLMYMSQNRHGAASSDAQVVVYVKEDDSEVNAINSSFPIDFHCPDSGFSYFSSSHPTPSQNGLQSPTRRNRHLL